MGGEGGGERRIGALLEGYRGRAGERQVQRQREGRKKMNESVRERGRESKRLRPDHDDSCHCHPFPPLPKSPRRQHRQQGFGLPIGQIIVVTSHRDVVSQLWCGLLITGSLVPGSRTLSPGFSIQEPESGIQDPGSWTQCRRLWVQDAGFWSLDPGSVILC
jgi:hypothetical protein